LALGTGTASGLVAAFPPRRERRFMFVLAAAAIVLGVGAVAIVSVPPSTLVRTNALLPEGTAPSDDKPSSDGKRVDPSSVPGSVSGSEPARDGRAAAAANKPAVETTELAAAGRRNEGAGSELPIIPATSLRGLGSRAPATPSGSAEAASAPSEQARLRVNEALTQPAKATPAPLPKKPPPKRAVARRAKPAPAASASAKATPASSQKVDCRQPFWIDEGGIRRLKMACL
jgi:hypothetical protein